MKLPLITACLLLSVVCLTFTKCEDKGTTKLQELEKSEQHYRDIADSLSKVIQTKQDTFYIYKTKIKIKNDTIIIIQREVAGLSADSAYAFFKQHTGATIIHD